MVARIEIGDAGFLTFQLDQGWGEGRKEHQGSRV